MGMKEGFGKYTFADGSTYEGEWYQDMIQGYGVSIQTDGMGY